MSLPLSPQTKEEEELKRTSKDTMWTVVCLVALGNVPLEEAVPYLNLSGELWDSWDVTNPGLRCAQNEPLCLQPI